jgi:hypothetical protein
LNFQTLTEEEQKEFYRLSRFCWKEARRCEEAKAYLAGSVMLGSALETLLILMINCHPDEAANSGKIPEKHGKPKHLVDWTLVELLKVAKAANWLPAEPAVNNDWNRKGARIGDHAEFVRVVRNFLHPARYCKDHSHRRVTRGIFETQLEVALLCRDWLVAHNNKCLLERPFREKIGAVSGGTII